MSSKEPQPHLWTIRFKHHKTTVLLFVKPQESFITIKADLLSALGKCGYSEIEGVHIPSDPNEVVLGILVDKNDPTQGWVPLDIPAIAVEESDGRKKKIGGKDGVLNSTPLGAGLKDGSMLAFKFRIKSNNVDEEGMDQADDEWDVIIPSYEDEYGSQSQQ